MNHFAEDTETTTGSTITEVQSPFGKSRFFNGPSSSMLYGIKSLRANFVVSDPLSTVKNGLTLVYRLGTDNSNTVNSEFHFI